MPMSLSHPINPSDNRLARRSFTRIGLIASMIFAVPVGLSGQTAPAAPTARPPTQCTNEPERHRFDFWLGEWDVTTRAGTKVGTSRIQSASNGCALLENWTGGNGGQGKSLNAYNPLIGQWQQFWIGADGGVSEYRSSRFDGASLVFLLTDSGKPDSIARLTFTPLDSATVRQHAETSGDRGNTWKTQYDFYYHRKAR
jgi:hypothetical protein